MAKREYTIEKELITYACVDCEKEILCMGYKYHLPQYCPACVQKKKVERNRTNAVILYRSKKYASSTMEVLEDMDGEGFRRGARFSAREFTIMLRMGYADGIKVRTLGLNSGKIFTVIGKTMHEITGSLQAESA